MDGLLFWKSIGQDLFLFLVDNDVEQLQFRFVYEKV